MEIATKETEKKVELETANPVDHELENRVIDQEEYLILVMALKALGHEFVKENCPEYYARYEQRQVKANQERAQKRSEDIRKRLHAPDAFGNTSRRKSKWSKAS